MSIEVEELLRAAGERTPAWSAAAEERAAGIARAIAATRVRRPVRRGRRIGAAALVLRALAAGGGALCLHSRPGGPRPRPTVIGAIRPTNYGDMFVRRRSHARAGPG